MNGLEIANRHVILVVAVTDLATQFQRKNGTYDRNQSGYNQAADGVTGLILAHAYLESNEFKVLFNTAPAP